MSAPTFEKSLNDLEKIVQQLEQGELPLTEALKQYEAGMALVKACRTELDQVEVKLTQMTTEGEQDA